MSIRLARLLLVVSGVTAIAACQRPAVGSRCTLTWNRADGSIPPPTPSTAQGDYFESGNIGCDDLTCIVSPAPEGSKYGSCSGEACGYCSKPCVSNADCYSSSTGLVCDQIVLDPAFLATLDETTKQRYLGEIRFSSYCVVPRQ
ncbi:adventurous gliding motility lipoprotein CglC [Anaeromyxobacter oryzae]|uniref:Lipoprotein n=1 Tax=Anaeromyxobacter oryzae TaxID=2918170 RepID=A0ABM7WZG8_9BACT|nr:adventurous gliding motility lipoprotein CglC [Anaeromyxobacter oryzae]BDG04927.1 hypothetical protein AMOR_39230 [Anaeromyxobacter oryzae]